MQSAARDLRMTDTGPKASPLSTAPRRTALSAAVLDRLQRLAGRLLRSDASGDRASVHHPVPHRIPGSASVEISDAWRDTNELARSGAFGFSGLPGEELLGAMSTEELATW